MKIRVGMVLRDKSQVPPRKYKVLSIDNIENTITVKCTDEWPDWTEGWDVQISEALFHEGEIYEVVPFSTKLKSFVNKIFHNK